MSLMRLTEGYTGAEIATFEGVSAEDLAKYDSINGPITMALEAAQLLNESFMDGVYAPNDLVMEAALEGYSDVMESGKMDAIKEKLKSAGKKVAELFRKMGNAVRAFFSNIGTKIRKKSTESIKKIKDSGVSEIEYNGYKYTHLDEIGKILKESTPESIYGKVGIFKAAINDQIKKEEAVDSANYKQQMDEALDDAKSKFGVKKLNDGSENTSCALSRYFRNGENGTSSPQKISASEAIKILKAGAAVYTDLDNVSAKIKKDYDSYADKCEKLAEKASADDSGSSSDIVAAWNAIAAHANKAQTFVNMILSTWSSAYAEASSVWAAGLKGSSTDDGDNKN